MFVPPVLRVVALLRGGHVKDALGGPVVVIIVF